MGAITGKQLKVRQRRVAGVGTEGEEIFEPHDWCENFATHDYDRVKEVYGGLGDEEKRQIDDILGGADSQAMESSGNLQVYLSDLNEGEKRDIMNAFKSNFPDAF